MNPRRVSIITLGCKVNQCDGDEMARALVSAGYDIVSRGEAEAYIVNTCTVTATADAKARKLIRKLAREHPDAPLVVTGCWAQCDAQAVSRIVGVGAVVPNEGKARIAEVVAGVLGALAARCQSNCTQSADCADWHRLAAESPGGPGSHPPSPRLRRASKGGYATSHRLEACATGGRERLTYSPAQARTRAFVKVQDGCDHHCAYCAVPNARGAPASKPLSGVLDELRRIGDEGAQEIVLCGIRLGAYGKERVRGDSLAGLLRAMRSIPIPRLRLSSIEPMDVDEELVDEMADHPRLCHHLHLPLQSGDDAVLAEMGREYTTADFALLVKRVRSVWPDIAFTTDVMVGFPGESDEQFGRTVAFVRGIGSSRLHVFPFSPRPGTAAAERRDRAPEKVKRERAAQLIQVGERLAQQAALKWVGREVQVLFEQEKAGRLTGLTEQYLRVWCDGPREWVGRIVGVRVREAERGELVGSG